MLDKTTDSILHSQSTLQIKDNQVSRDSEKSFLRKL